MRKEDEGYEVNAWFRHDWKPLTELEVSRYSQLLTWSPRKFLRRAVWHECDHALHIC